jgi:light-regulated signal transduction histidine kinase (bacteriophytochrome)
VKANATFKVTSKAMFDEQEKRLASIKAFLSTSLSEQPGAARDQLSKLADWYQELLQESKFITKVSDRLEKRLIEQNNLLLEGQEELQTAKEEIQTHNDLLELQVRERTQQVQESNLKLKRALLELDDFIYRSSHDLKGPIVRLVGLYQLLRMEENLPKSADVYLKHMELVTEQMQTLLEQLIHVQELKHSKPVIKEVSVDVLLESICGNFRQRLRENEVNLYLNTEGQRQLFIYTDYQKLQELLSNLINFALRNLGFQPKGEFGYIKLHAQQDQGVAYIQLIYTGEIISPANVSEIFRLFRRYSNDPNNLGTDLYTANILAEQLGGSLQFINSSATDTHFLLSLPQ